VSHAVDLGAQATLDALRRYVARRVEATQRDEVLGAVLLRLVEHRAELDSAAHPVAWMLRVTANLIADHGRRRERRQRLFVEQEAALQQAPAPESDVAPAAAAELAACLRPLIDGLPRRYAEALRLTDLGGLTQREAALRLGLSASGMRSRVQRARARLRAALLRCCRIHLDRHGAVVDYDPHCGCTEGTAPGRRAAAPACAANRSPGTPQGVADGGVSLSRR